MGFDFNNSSGESFGNIEDVFFKKDGKSIIDSTSSNNSEKINLNELKQSIHEKSMQHHNNASGTTITISKEILDLDEDKIIQLSPLEERRMNISSVRNKSFININDGSEITIIEKTQMYNGVNLYTAKQENGEMITYPRSMFVGSTKQFVPKEFYIREAERVLEDTIVKHYNNIKVLLEKQELLEETPDSKYLELMLSEPLSIGSMVVPDKVQIPVKRIFDMEYKIMFLENVICLDNKIASLLFIDIWF